jgi:hypothetical protein
MQKKKQEVAKSQKRNSSRCSGMDDSMNGNRNIMSATACIEGRVHVEGLLGHLM